MDELQAVAQMLAEPPPAPEVVEAAQGRLERAVLSGTPLHTRGIGQRWQAPDPVRRSAPPRRRPGWLAPAAAAAAVVVVTFASLGISGAIGHGASSTGPAAGPPAPRQFNPLVPGISFGWLPAGESLNQGGVTPAESYMDAGGNGPDWSLGVYARGQCHLTGSPSGLDCPWSKLQISRPAPGVAGHRAFWTGADSGPGIAWEYARGGWAQLTIPAANLSAVLHGKGDLTGKALKIASHVRFGVTTRLAFATQFPGLPSQWRVHDVSYYVPDGGVLNAQEYILTTPSSRFHPHVGDLGVWTNAPYLTVTPAPGNSTCSAHDPAYKTTRVVIHGYHLFLMRSRTGGLPTQELCGARADGLQFHLEEFGAHPSISVTTLFRDHVRLLGTNPADWTRYPLG